MIETDQTTIDTILAQKSKVEKELKQNNIIYAFGLMPYDARFNDAIKNWEKEYGEKIGSYFTRNADRMQFTTTCEPKLNYLVERVKQ